MATSESELNEASHLRALLQSEKKAKKVLEEKINRVVCYLDQYLMDPTQEFTPNEKTLINIVHSTLTEEELPEVVEVGDSDLGKASSALVGDDTLPEV